MPDETARWASPCSQGVPTSATKVTCVQRVFPVEGLVFQHSVRFPWARCNLNPISSTDSAASGATVQKTECKHLSLSVLYVSFHGFPPLLFSRAEAQNFLLAGGSKLMLLSWLTKKKKIWNIKSTPIIHQSSIIKQKGWLAKINAKTSKCPGLVCFTRGTVRGVQAEDGEFHNEARIPPWSYLIQLCLLPCSECDKLPNGSRHLGIPGGTSA